MEGFLFSKGGFVLKIIAISDVHGKWNKLTIPECDLLISAGDYSFRGEVHMVKDFHKWLDKQPAKNIISVQGNHEVWVEKNFDEARKIAQEQCPRVVFVEHDMVRVYGLKIFCSAWSPEFHRWAYNGARTLEDAQRMQIPYIKDKWADIPIDCDIVVTHTPCHGFLDQVYHVDGVTPKERVGCWHLLERFMQTNAKVHICGHIHSGHGFKEFNGKHLYNASICGETYAVDYEPIIIEWDENE
jgi:Icc-related predicted phosphoesterase